MNGRLSVVGIALGIAVLMGACSKGTQEKPAGQSTKEAEHAAVPKAESGQPAPPAQEAAPAEVKTYVFHATPAAVDAGNHTLTVKHEKIGDYQPEGTSTFTVADPAILAEVKVGSETHLTLRVAGDKALVVKAQTGHEKGEEH